jgi:hypothetical protein
MGIGAGCGIPELAGEPPTPFDEGDGRLLRIPAGGTNMCCGGGVIYVLREGGGL